MDDHHRPLPEASSSSQWQDAKVAIPRIHGHDYEMPTTTRAPRVRTDVVSKAVSTSWIQTCLLDRS